MSCRSFPAPRKSSEDSDTTSLIQYIPGEDGQDGEDSIIPGPAGMVGATGSSGLPGLQGGQGIPGEDGQDGEDSIIPGPAGMVGATGSSGLPGLQGEQGIPGMPGEDGEPGYPSLSLAPSTALPYLGGDGLGLTHVSTSSLTIDVGRCRDDTNTFDIVVPTAITPVAITASGANGLDTGAEAGSTWYHVWVIAKPDGSTAGLLSLSSTTPTVPTGYTYKRRLGVRRNNSASNFLNMRMLVQDGFRERAYYYEELDTVLIRLSAGAGQAPFTNIDLNPAVGGLVPPTSTRVIGKCSCNAVAGSVFRPDGWAAATGGPVVITSNARTANDWEMSCPGQLIEYANTDPLGATNMWVSGFIEVI